MWRKDEGRPQGPSDVSTGSVNSNTSAGAAQSAGKNVSAGPGVSPKASACVSQGIKIRGEVTGSEDLFVDGQFEGKLSLGNSVLTIGPNATVKADVSARDVIVRGRIEGKLTGTERIQIWHSARINGDMKAERISIEEGAELHGKMEAGKPTPNMTEKAKNEGPRKEEAKKPKDAVASEEKPASGAAVAGAD
jgi:cytoskeletal protein CcmA (bactofilin family)